MQKFEVGQKVKCTEWGNLGVILTVTEKGYTVLFDTDYDGVPQTCDFADFADIHCDLEIA